MGWNELAFRRPHPVFAGIKAGEHAYFCHSYHMVCDDPADLVATADHGLAVTAAVARDSLIGVQFHPENSQAFGLALLANFLEWRP
jgi:glutamine amidotransferase